MTADVKTCSISWCHFPNLSPNSYVNLNNMKLDLNVSTKVKFIENLFKNKGNCRFLLRAITGAFAEMKSLHVSYI